MGAEFIGKRNLCRNNWMKRGERESQRLKNPFRQDRKINDLKQHRGKDNEKVFLEISLKSHSLVCYIVLAVLSVVALNAKGRPEGQTPTHLSVFV